MVSGIQIACFGLWSRVTLSIDQNDQLSSTASTILMLLRSSTDIGQLEHNSVPGATEIPIA